MSYWYKDFGLSEKQLIDEEFIIRKMKAFFSLNDGEYEQLHDALYEWARAQNRNRGSYRELISLVKKLGMGSTLCHIGRDC